MKRFHPTQKPLELFRWILKNYSKENLKEALLIHKELFDLKLQALPSDNTYITYLTKKYQNLFESIEGKEYNHNLFFKISDIKETKLKFIKNEFIVKYIKNKHQGF